MRISRFLLAVALAMTAAAGTWAPAAGADCVGPRMRFTPHDVGRGETVAVSGTNWGDNCYDTGPPPAGEGVLGRPIAGISVVLLQDGQEWELWSGGADADYAFNASVTVPPDVAPGVAMLAARRDDSPAGWDLRTYNPEPELRISAAPPVSTTSASAAPTSPVPTLGTSQVGASSGSKSPTGNEGSSSTVVLAGAVAVVAVMVVAAALVARRRRS